MKKVLLITGKSAAEITKKYAGMSKTPFEIHVCDTDVAALISMELITSELSRKNLSNISTIIVPGQMKGNASVISGKLGIPCFKGPTQAADLPLVLDLLPCGVSLSTTKSANSVLEEEINRRTKREIEKAYKAGKYTLNVGNVKLGTGITQVLAEIADAPMLSDDEILEKAVFGMLPKNKLRTEQIKRLKFE